MRMWLVFNHLQICEPVHPHIGTGGR